jgi:hypothetical protein
LVWLFLALVLVTGGCASPAPAAPTAQPSQTTDIPSSPRYTAKVVKLYVAPG